MKGFFDYRWNAFIAVAVLLVMIALSPGCGGAAKKSADNPSDSPVMPSQKLQEFLSAMGAKDYEKAYTFVAPSTVENGDAIAPEAPCDKDSFMKELEKAETAKKDFSNYKLGKFRWEDKNRFRIWAEFKGGERDETVLVWEDGNWYVADPIHIIR